MYVHIYIYIYICICICIYIYVYIYVYIHIHISIYTPYHMYEWVVQPSLDITFTLWSVSFHTVVGLFPHHCGSHFTLWGAMISRLLKNIGFLCRI